MERRSWRVECGAANIWVDYDLTQRAMPFDAIPFRWPYQIMADMRSAAKGPLMMAKVH